MPSALASLIVFTTSAAVLVLEILAGRLLAPYVGVTLETFTAIIGVVLGAMALGTWVGGILADRTAPARLLPPCLVLGGATAIASVPVVRALGSAALGTDPGTVVLLTTLGFFAPAAVLSAASPLVVKIQLDDLDRTGHVVGRLSAIGTAGALVGVFVTGFVLVAAFPTTPVVIAVGALLVAGGLALAVWFRRNPPGDRPVAPAARALSVSVIAAVAASGVAVTWSGPCETETAYFCARVEADPDRPGGRTLWLDTLRHSYVDLDDPTHLQFGYVAVFGDLIDLVALTAERGDTAPDVLHIGGGGFTLPRYVDTAHPGSTNIVLELDPELVGLAERELGLELSADLRVVTGDARTGIRRVRADEPDLRFDVVVGDAFGGLAVPWHLTTREFAHEIRAVLAPGGVYGINVIDQPPQGFLRAQTATLLDVFEHVALVAPAERLRGEEGGNVVVLASDGPLPTDALSARLVMRGADDVVLADPPAIAELVGEAMVLTDERAPVDQLLTTRDGSRR